MQMYIQMCIAEEQYARGYLVVVFLSMISGGLITSALYFQNKNNFGFIILYILMLFTIFTINITGGSSQVHIPIQILPR